MKICSVKLTTIKMIHKYYRLVFLFVLPFILFSCKRTHHEFYFDIKDQKMICCDNVRVYQFTINNDSITAKGFPYESGKVITWEGDRGLAPLEFSFNNIPKSFHYFESKSAINFKFKPNNTYSIKKFGGGNPSFKIRVWTDSKGKVFKTSHSTCGLKTLDLER